jgi:polyhydroxyalkanoate synthesis regulator phasin
MSPQKKGKKRDIEEAELDSSLKLRIQEYEKMKEPTISDVWKILLDVLKNQLTSQSTAEDLNDRVSHLEKTVSTLEDKIEKVSLECDRIETTSHKTEQKEVDRDIYIGNFPNKPN